MDYIRKFIRDFFGFSGREINGFLILLLFMLLIISSEPLYSWWASHRVEDFTHERRKLDSLIALWEFPVETDPRDSRDSLFNFNPNKVSQDDFVALGVSRHLATRIASYRQKGGTFRVKADLLKIYGFDSTLYAKLYPFILLPDKKSLQRELQHEKQSVQSQKNQFARFDINQADTIQLKSVYGIGTKLAGRIIKFRDALGGFIKMEQLTTVYGLDSATVQQLVKKSFISADFTPRKVNLNTANEQELSAHPYIHRSAAKAIVAWRFQHGNFTDAQDLAKLKVITTEDINKLLPYLKIQD
jgi:competence protein ComEA